MSRANDRLLLHQRLILGSLLLVMAGSAVLLWRLSTRPVRGPREGRTTLSEVEASARPDEVAAHATDPASPRVEEREALADSAPAPARDPAALEAFAADACYGRAWVEDVPEAGVELLFFQDGLGFLEARTPTARAATDDEGRFRIEGLLPHREYVLVASSPRIVTRFDSVRPGESLELELERAVPVTGFVRRASDRAPLPGVGLSIVRQTWDGTRRAEFLEARTDDEGRFTLAGVGEGQVTFQVARPGHLAERREFQVTADSQSPFEILLEDGHPLELVIVELASGEPLRSTELATHAGIARTDEQGRLFLPAAARRDESSRVSLSLPGDTLTEGRIAPAQVQTLSVPVAHGARIRGRVLDAREAPVAGAVIRLVGGGRPLQRDDLPEGFRLGDPRQLVRSDAEGFFELVGCVPRAGEVRVRATHPLHPLGESTPFPLQRLGEELEVEVRLEQGASVTGHVTLDGQPVALDVHWSGEVASGRTRSNARGEFRIEGLKPGELTLRARLGSEDAEEPRPEDLTVRVAAGETLEVELALTRLGATIEGRVIDASGAPVPEAYVMAYLQGDEQEEVATPSARSGRDGEFTLALPDGLARLFTVQASIGPRRVERASVAPGTRGLELVLPELGQVALRVEDALTREAVERYTLYWRASDEGRYQRYSPQGRGVRLSSGPDGVHLAELPVGRLDLVVCERTRGYLPSFREAVVVTREGRLELRFALETGVALELVVKGTPAQRGMLRRTYVQSEEQARLAARGGDFYQQEVRIPQSLRPDAEGVLRLSGMPSGTYRIEGLPRSLTLAPARFTLESVASERVELSLESKESQPASQPGRERR